MYFMEQDATIVLNLIAQSAHVNEPCNAKAEFGHLSLLKRVHWSSDELGIYGDFPV